MSRIHNESEWLKTWKFDRKEENSIGRGRRTVGNSEAYPLRERERERERDSWLINIYFLVSKNLVLAAKDLCNADKHVWFDYIQSFVKDITFVFIYASSAEGNGGNNAEN